MRPTANARSLALPISEALGQTRGMLEPGSSFDPATARRRLSLAVTDYGDLVVVPPLVKALRRDDAPCIDLAVRPIIDAATSVASLERGDVDALIGGYLPASFVCIRDAKRAGRKTRLSRDATFTFAPHPARSDIAGLGVLLGLAFPALAEAAMPMTIFLTVLGTLLRVDNQAVVAALRRPSLSVLLPAVVMVGCPLVIGVAVHALNLGPDIALAVVLAVSAPPSSSTAAVARMLGLDGAVLLVMTVLSMVLAPITVPLLAGWFGGSRSERSSSRFGWLC
jgi:hypothetical protein